MIIGVVLFLLKFDHVLADLVRGGEPIPPDSYPPVVNKKQLPVCKQVDMIEEH